MPSKKVATPKSKPKPTAWDDEPTPVPGSKTEYVTGADTNAWVDEPAGRKFEQAAEVSGEQVFAAQRVAAKVAKALKRSRVPHADQLRIAHLALLAVAAGPKSVSRDIAVNALKVVTS